MSTEEIQEITDNAIPVTTTTIKHKVRNENNQRYVPVKVSLKSCKISNINIEILLIHEDYVTTTTIFTLMLLNGLASPGGTKFSKPTEEMSKEELNVFRKSFCTSAGNRDGTLSVLQKFINEIHLRATIDRFRRSLPLNKPFSTISDPAFTEGNKVLGHLQKSSEKQATLPA